MFRWGLLQMLWKLLWNFVDTSIKGTVDSGSFWVRARRETKDYNELNFCGKVSWPLVCLCAAEVCTDQNLQSCRPWPWRCCSGQRVQCSCSQHSVQRRQRCRHHTSPALLHANCGQPIANSEPAIANSGIGTASFVMEGYMVAGRGQEFYYSDQQTHLEPGPGEAGGEVGGKQRQGELPHQQQRHQVGGHL